MKIGKKDIIIIALVILNIASIITLIMLNREPKDEIKNLSDSEYFKGHVLDISKCYKQKCKEKFNFNNNEMYITQDDNLNYQLRINNKLVSSGESSAILHRYIYVFDNILLISNYYEALDSYVTYLYNINEEKLETLEISDDDSSWYYKDISVNDTTITYHLSKFALNDEYIEKKAFIFETINNCNSFNKYKDKVVARDYISVYENGNLSKPKQSNEYLLNNYKEYSKLCN